MIGRVVHIGVTVTNLEKSMDFYENVLGLKLQGKMVMKGKETDALFNMENVEVKIAYYNGSDELLCPPVELLEFSNGVKAPCSLNQTSISEICFIVKDIDAVYNRLKSKGVEFLSEPQFFDFTKEGFSKSRAVYFKDNDGIILELMEYL